MDGIACDVSEWQRAVSSSYPHRWLIFRACDGSYRDKRAQANLAWAIAARTSKRRVRTALRNTTLIDGFTVYVVYRPGQNAAILANLDGLGVPRDCTLMIDVESWGGAITGNRSAEINTLADKLASRQGSRINVWGYANRGDFAAIWPQRPAWLGLVVASYGGTKPANPGPGPMVGWQYTNGQWDVPGLPKSSKPFGACDHNQLYLTVKPQSEEFTVGQYEDLKAAVDARFDRIDKRLTALFQVDSNGDGKADYTGTVQNAVLASVRAEGAAPAAKAAATSAAAAVKLDTEIGLRVAALGKALDAQTAQIAALQAQITDLANGKVSVTGTIPATLTIGAP